MIRNDRIINSLIHGDAVEKLIKENNIDVTEARAMISEMSFKDYCALDEASADIVPPSGKPLSPTGPGGEPPAAPGTPIKPGTTPANPPGQQSQPAATAPTPVKPAADPRGVQVKNPQTGKMEWMKPSVDQSGKPVAEDKELTRMKQLAGIVEDGSGGASCAGGIAVAPMPMGGVKRRQPTDEELKKEYTPKVAKTVVGDTKPSQASGELSANLAVRGKKTASRTNNGFKR